LSTNVRNLFHCHTSTSHIVKKKSEPHFKFSVVIFYFVSADADFDFCCWHNHHVSKKNAIETCGQGEKHSLTGGVVSIKIHTKTLSMQSLQTPELPKKTMPKSHAD